MKVCSGLLLLFGVFVVLVVVPLHEGVDRSKFRTCEQTGFCRRNRRLSDTPHDSNLAHEYASQAVLLSETIQVTELEFTAQLVLLNAAGSASPHSANNNNLLLTVNYYGEGIFRLVVDEKDSPIKKRYRTKDVLLETLQRAPFRVLRQNDEEIVLLGLPESSQAQLRIQFQPLKVEGLWNGRPVLVGNQRGLFNFEHYRTKEETQVAPPPEEPKVEGEEEQAEGEENKADVPQPVPSSPQHTRSDDGSWEETFGSHHDTKHFGPSSVGMDFQFVNSPNVYGKMRKEFVSSQI